MRVHQINELKQVGYTLSDKFKTVGTYGLQPIILSNYSYKIVMVYINRIRELILPDKNNWDPNDFLWVDYNGKPQRNIGRLITKYFRKKIKVNVTTTCFRSLYETESDTLFNNGIISASDRASIRQISGHSSATVRKYYLKKNINQNVENSRNVLKSLSATSPTNYSIDDDYQVNSDQYYCPPANPHMLPSITSKAPWGTLHSSYQSDRHKIPWDNAEINYLGKLATSLIREDSEKYSKTIMSHCLKRIKNDPIAISIFHENHILSTGNYYYYYLIILLLPLLVLLKHGWLRYKRENNIK